ncbi:MAG: hypothetical protein ACK4SY_04630 [Pyrobaculum sp.]
MDLRRRSIDVQNAAVLSVDTTGGETSARPVSPPSVRYVEKILPFLPV